MKAKRAKNKNNYLKNILSTLFLIIILFTGSFYLYFYFSSHNEKENLENKSSTIEENILEDSNKINEEGNLNYVSIEDMPKNINSHKVIAKLEIPKIELSTYVLEKTTPKALKVSITKLYGPEPNDDGNFCVSGHNDKNTMFKNLKDIQIDDEIVVTNSEGLQISYKVYDIFIVEPEDVSCLSQDTNGKREITLVTCTTGGKLRIIVKAMQN